MPPTASGGLTVIFILWRRKCLGFVNPKRAFPSISGKLFDLLIVAQQLETPAIQAVNSGRDAFLLTDADFAEEWDWFAY